MRDAHRVEDRRGALALAIAITSEKSFVFSRLLPGTAVIRVVNKRSLYDSHGIRTQFVVAMIGPGNCVNSTCWFCQAEP